MIETFIILLNKYKSLLGRSVITCLDISNPSIGSIFAALNFVASSLGDSFCDKNKNRGLLTNSETINHNININNNKNEIKMRLKILIIIILT